MRVHELWSRLFNKNFVNVLMFFSLIPFILFKHLQVTETFNPDESLGVQFLKFPIASQITIIKYIIKTYYCMVFRHRGHPLKYAIEFDYS